MEEGDHSGEEVKKLDHSHEQRMVAVNQGLATNSDVRFDVEEVQTHDEERTRSDDDIHRELMFLIIHALQDTPLRDIGRELANRALQQRLLPYRVDFTGRRHQTGYDELASLYDHVPHSALLDALQRLRHKGGRQEGGLDGKGGGGDTVASLLDREVLGCWGDTARPAAWLQPLTSLHNGGKGEHMARYLEMRRGGWLPNTKDGTGLPNAIRNDWQHHFTVRGHANAAYCVVFDKTGDRIITASDDRLVKIWSSRTALLLCSCRGHMQEISDLAVSVDNKVVASASVDGMIRLWNLQSGDELGYPIGVLRGHRSLVSSIVFSPRNSYELLSSSFDGTCRVWDIRDGNYTSIQWNWRDGRGQQHSVTEMNLRRRSRENEEENDESGESLNGRRNLRPRRHHEQREYMVQPREDNENEEEEEEDEEKKVSVAIFTKDGRHILAGVAQGSICIWRWHAVGEIEDGVERTVAEAKQVELLTGAHGAEVYLLQQGNSGGMFITGSSDGVVSVWSPAKGGHHRRLVPIDTWKCVASFKAPPAEEDLTQSRRRKGPEPRVDQIALNADETLIIASVQTFKVLVYSIPQQKIIHELGGVHEEPVHVVMAHPIDPSIAITSSYSGDVVVWDILAGQKLSVFHSIDARPDERQWPERIAYIDGYMSPNGQAAALTDAAGQLHFFGFGPPDSLISRAPFDQYFLLDYEDIFEDENGVVRSVEHGTPAHIRLPINTLCDATVTPYPQGFQLAYRSHTVLSAPARDVAWRMPGQRPGYVMAAPTLTAASWRVFATGGSQRAAASAVDRAQLLLQDYEQRLDGEPIDAGRNQNDRNHNVRGNNRNEGPRFWATISDSDESDEDSDGSPVRPVRQSQRLSSRGQEEAENRVNLSYEDERERQRLDRARRAERRQQAISGNARSSRQHGARRSQRRSAQDIDYELLAEGEEVCDFSCELFQCFFFSNHVHDGPCSRLTFH